MDDKEYAYSEIFYSMQGEGHYTGEPTAWLRFFLCNLQCDGFGQKDPTNPDTYKLPYKEIDVDQYDSIEKLPVFEYGCDSSYSWSKKFKHLQNKATGAVIAERILDAIPNRTFDNNIHMCFTGGEPLMPHAQHAIVAIMNHFQKIGQECKSVTIESNGTQRIRLEFWEYFKNVNQVTPELFMSFSPKLYTVSGEKRERAIKVDYLKEWNDHFENGQIKFVANGTKECWDEIDEVLALFKEAGINNYPVWIMPLGGTLEGQEGKIEGHIPASEIADEALRRGYRVSARVHTYIWGNAIGK